MWKHLYIPSSKADISKYMAFGRERERTSEGLFPFIRWRMACPHSLGGHCTEWWPGGGQSHSQPCLGARRAAKVAPAVAGDRSPQSPLCSHGICEHAQLGLSAQGGDEPSAMLWLVVLVPATITAIIYNPLLSQSRKMVSNSCYFELVLQRSQSRVSFLLSFLSMHKQLTWGMAEKRPQMFGNKNKWFKGEYSAACCSPAFWFWRVPGILILGVEWCCEQQVTGHRWDGANSCFNLALYRKIFLKNKSCNLIISIWTLLVRTAFKFLKVSLLEKELKTVLAKSFILTTLVLADFWLTCKFIWEKNLIFFNWSM